MAVPSLNDIRARVAALQAGGRASSYSLMDLISQVLHEYAGQYIDPSVQGAPGQPNGVAVLDANAMLSAAQIPAYTGLLAKDFDPGSQQYNRASVTTLKTYDVGDGAHIIITGFSLPARGNANLKTRLTLKFSDNSTVTINNATDAASNGSMQLVAELLMGDPIAGQDATNNDKRVRYIIFEVQNMDANNDYTVDIGAFRVRAYVVPRGGGTVTTTP